MVVIEGAELKPCGEMYTKTKDMYVNLMTRCNYVMCQEGCFSGKGGCTGYFPMKRISKNIQWIASQIERSK